MPDPRHVPKEWIAKYKDKLDQGWDKVREEPLARQIKLGTVPLNTKLAAMPHVHPESRLHLADLVFAVRFNRRKRREQR